jgi:hypothetical protein
MVDGLLEKAGVDLVLDPHRHPDIVFGDIGSQDLVEPHHLLDGGKGIRRNLNRLVHDVLDSVKILIIRKIIPSCRKQAY